MNAAEPPGVDLAALTGDWLRRWPAVPPVPAVLFAAHPDRTLRLSVPPGPDGLHRYGVLLDRLFGRRQIYVVTGSFADVADPAVQPRHLAGVHPAAVHWLRLLGRDERSYHERALDLYVSRRPWRPGGVDPLLAAAWAGMARSVLIMDTGLHRMVHPDGTSVDVLTVGPAERDELRLDFRRWLARPGVTASHTGNTI